MYTLRTSIRPPSQFIERKMLAERLVYCGQSTHIPIIRGLSSLPVHPRNSGVCGSQLCPAPAIPPKP